MTRFDFYKELYYKELERKKALNDSLTLPIGIITGLIAWLFYFYNNYLAKVELQIPLWLYIVYLVSLIALLVAIYFLTLSYFQPKFKREKYYCYITSGYDYYYIDVADAYESYYHETNKEEDLEALLIEHLVVCSQYNTALNDRKTARLLRAKIYLVFCLFLSFLLLVYPAINRSNLNQTKPQEVRIVDTVKIYSMDLIKGNLPLKEEGKPQPPPQPQPQPQPKPEKAPVRKPQIRIIPETRVPPPGNPLHS